jgi:hypothetical protein
MQRRVTLFLAGGLGNQLFQYAAALSRKPTNLYLDCQLGMPRVNHFGDADILDFVLPIDPKILDKKNSESFFMKVVWFLIRFGFQPKKWEKFFLSRFVILMGGILSITVWMRRPTMIKVATESGYWKIRKYYMHEYLIGYFQSYVWASQSSIYGQLKGIHLKLPSESFSSFYNTVKYQNAVAVHVRLGDYEKDRGFGIPTPEYYELALRNLEGSMDIEHIWLFSNVPEDAISYIPEKYSQIVTVIPAFEDSAAETLELMRHATSYVIGNPTFSWWGAFLSYRESPIVIAPKPWSKFGREPSQLIPPHWIRLEAWPKENKSDHQY